MTDKDEKNVSVTSNKDSLMTWLRGGTRTFGWDAVVGFDRSAIDTVFREQYVRRLNESRRYPIITGTIDLTGRQYRTLASVVLGPPKVSFDVSRVDVATPSVRVTLPVVSAQEVKLIYGIDAFVTVERINPISILQSPELTGVLDFKPLAYEGSLGTIALDLKDGTYEFTLAESDWEARKVGDFFKTQFQTWTSEESQWVVNRMLRSSGPLAVERFAIRSQRKSVTARASDPNYGEGAVLAFVKMEARYGENSDGKDKTSLPTTEAGLHYWVPDDPEEQYTTTIVIQDARLLYGLIMNAFRSSASGWMFEEQPFKFSVITVADRNRLILEQARLRLLFSKEYRPTPTTSFAWIGGIATIGTGENTISMEIEQPSAVNNFAASVLMRISLVDVVSEVWTNSDYANTREESEIMFSGKCQIRFILQFDNNNKSIGVRTAGHVISDLSFKSYRYESEILTWDQVSPYLPDAAAACIRRMTEAKNSDSSLELFPLTSLLFHFPYITKLAEVSLAQDAVMFGHIAPGLMDFKVTDPFPVVAAGSTYRFTINSSIPVIWSIRNVLGENEPIGSVLGGVYTAPTAGQITGTQVQVVVTATAGLSTAAALLTVVRNTLELNPLLQFVAAGAHAVRLEVATLSGTTVWGDVDPARGRLEAIAGEPNARLFYPPPKSVLGLRMDVVPVSISAGGVREQAFVGVTHSQFNYTPLTTTFDAANRTVQLGFPGHLPAPPNPVWEVVAGSATIDSSSGLLTADADPAIPFVVVVVTVDYNIPSLLPLWGHVTLTLPLAPFPAEPEPEKPGGGGESDSLISLNLCPHS